MRQFINVVACILCFAAVSSPARAAVIPLYDGAAMTTPDAQGWLYLTSPIFGPMATQSAAGGVTTLDTTPVIGEMAGYFGNLHPSIPVLDRTTGFTLTFDIRVSSESHLNSNRAGFSIIALSQDLQGIELGFWTDEIWAQSGPAFTHAEGRMFDTASSLTQYALTILGGGYLLFADGDPILGGALRDYSSFGTPYTVPSLVFLGDDTGSAAAEIDLAAIGLRTGDDILVPEPGTLALLGMGLIALAFGRFASSIRLA